MFNIPEARTIGNTEFPLSIQLQYGPHTNALDLRLIQVKQKHNGGSNKERNNHQGETDSEEEEEDDVGDNRDVTPKDEGPFYKTIIIVEYHLILLLRVL